MKFLLFAALAAVIFWVVRRALRAGPAMSVEEAQRLLEVAPDADLETIIAAHRRLIAKVHPDAGGSASLAAQVNRARDILVRRLTS